VGLLEPLLASLLDPELDELVALEADLLAIFLDCSWVSQSVGG